MEFAYTCLLIVMARGFLFLRPVHMSWLCINWQQGLFKTPQKIHVHVLPWVCCVSLFGLACFFFDLSYSLMSCILTNVCVCYSYRLVLRCTRWLSSCWSSPSQTTTPYSTCPLSWQLPLSTSHARSVGVGNG